MRTLFGTALSLFCRRNRSLLLWTTRHGSHSPKLPLPESPVLRVGVPRATRRDTDDVSSHIIMCMGSAFMYALTNADVSRVLDTFVAHSHPGTLLILDINNASSYLGGDHFKQTSELRVSSPSFSAVAHSSYSFDRRRQLVVRKRTWNIDGHNEIEDFCEYRLFFTAEIEHLIGEKEFKVAGMFDNMELRDSDLSGPRLYVAAVFEPNAPHT